MELCSNSSMEINSNSFVKHIKICLWKLVPKAACIKQIFISLNGFKHMLIHGNKFQDFGICLWNLSYGCTRRIACTTSYSANWKVSFSHLILKGSRGLP